MKDIDIGTVGGRIRSCRKQLELSLEEMSKKIGVSPNYVSVIERNVKNPSDKVLNKVADLAGVSFDWLKKGDGRDANTEPMESSLQPAMGKGSIDASLFLNLALCCGTTISKETISTVLNVDAKSLEGIMKGTVQFDPAWENGLSNIAQRLELPSMIEKLHEIVSFLEKVQTQKIDFELIRLSRDYLAETYKDTFIYCSSHRYDNEIYTDLWRPNRHDGMPIRTFYFQQLTVQDKWRVQIYTKMDGNVAEEALFRAIDSRPNHNDFNSVLMFTNKETFDSLVAKKEQIYKYRVAGTHEKTKSISVRLVLINPDSMCIENETFDTL